jgi:hypothetical protein
MRRIVFIVLIGLILSCDTERNIPLLAEDTFLKFYGVEGEQTGVDFVLTADNAIVMVGNSNMPGGTQMIYVVKVDLLGNVIWENMIGLADKNNTVKDIELDTNGRLVIAGETEIAVGNRDVFVKILDGNGGELDSTRYSLSTNNKDEVVNSITVVEASSQHQAGFIVSGYTNDVPGNLSDDTDGIHIRFTDDLEIPIATWEQKTGAGGDRNVLVKTIQINGDLLYGFGYTNFQRLGNSFFKYWVFELNDGGIPEDNDPDLLDAMLLPQDTFLKSVTDVDISDPFYKGFLLQGVSVDASGNSKSYTVKLKRDLGFTANDIYGEKTDFPLGSNLTDRSMASFYNPFNNDYLVLATRNLGSDLAEGIALYKLDRENQLEWGPQVFGGESFDEAGAVLQLPDGKIMVLGTMTVGGLNGQKKMALMKLNDKGKLLR